MALIKSIEIEESGVFAEYIKIVSATVNHTRGQVFMELEYYKDQVARASGKNPIHKTSLKMPISGVTLTGTIHQIEYQILKTHPDMENAVDALE